jgi:D-glycero-D-manno-heptose 1,7-bisphosphate phosphatase
MNRIFINDKLSLEQFSQKNIAHFSKLEDLLGLNVDEADLIITDKYVQELNVSVFMNSNFNFSLRPCIKTNKYLESGLCKFKSSQELLSYLGGDRSQLSGGFVPIKHSGASRKVVFLDRDGILIKDTEYPHEVEKLIFKDEILPLLNFYKDQGHNFIVITNQSGIGRGYFGEKEYYECKQAISKYYQSHGISFLAWYFCPYHVDGLGNYKIDSIYRKPNPSMIYDACNSFNINLNQSLMIGDNKSDRLNLEELESVIISKQEHGDFNSFEEFLSSLKSK